MNQAKARDIQVTIHPTLNDPARALGLIREVEARHQSMPKPWVNDLLAQAEGPNTAWLAAYQKETLVGCGLILRDGPVHMATLLGLDYSVEYAYFQLMYAAIQNAMQAGARALRAGSGAYAFKKHLGFELEDNNHLVYAGCGPLFQTVGRWLGQASNGWTGQSCANTAEWITGGDHMPLKTSLNLQKLWVSMCWSRSRGYRIVLVLAGMYAVLRLALQMYVLFDPTSQEVAADLQTYLNAAHSIQLREALYPSGALVNINFYQYTPPFAFLFIPFTWLSPLVTALLHTLFHIAAYILLYVYWGRIFQNLNMPRVGQAQAWLLPVWLIFTPFWGDLAYLNIYIPVALLATLLIHAVINERLRWAVVCLAALLLIKPQWAFPGPAALIVGQAALLHQAHRRRGGRLPGQLRAQPVGTGAGLCPPPVAGIRRLTFGDEPSVFHSALCRMVSLATTIRSSRSWSSCWDPPRWPTS